MTARREIKAALQDAERANAGMTRARRYGDRVMYELYERDAEEALDRATALVIRARRLILFVAIPAALTVIVPFMVMNATRDGTLPKVAFVVQVIAVAFLLRQAWRLYHVKSLLN